MGVMHIPGHEKQGPREVGLDEIREVMGDCRLCQLCQTRTNIVFGTGNPHARVMFVGEAPGKNEDLQGEPFVGRGGQLLDKMLAAVGLSREKNVYIANIVKCRPPQNRDPLPEEKEACIGWLRRQTALIKPKIIVCLGRVAACRLISPEFKVTREHGQFIEKNGVWMMGTLHPAAVLRVPAKKPEWFEDFLALREKIGEVCARTELVYPE